MTQKTMIDQLNQMNLLKKKEKKPIQNSQVMVDGFGQLTQAMKEAKENSSKGPVDLKIIRQELNAANSKNRRP
jgi:hypothetical protein